MAVIAKEIVLMAGQKVAIKAVYKGKVVTVGFIQPCVEELIFLPLTLKVTPAKTKSFFAVSSPQYQGGEIPKSILADHCVEIAVTDRKMVLQAAKDRETLDVALIKSKKWGKKKQEPFRVTGIKPA